MCGKSCQTDVHMAHACSYGACLFICQTVVHMAAVVHMAHACSYGARLFIVACSCLLSLVHVCSCLFIWRMLVHACSYGACLFIWQQLFIHTKSSKQWRHTCLALDGHIRMQKCGTHTHACVISGGRLSNDIRKANKKHEGKHEMQSCMGSKLRCCCSACATGSHHL